MDETPKYMKMCRQVWNDLSREPWDYDIVAFKYCYYEKAIKQGIEHYRDIIGEWKYRDEEFQGGYLFIMWKQTQLQEMLDSSITTRLTHLLRLFHKFTRRKSLDRRFRNDDYFSSMEQLWLAFVMSENYNKFWNDKRGEWKKNTK